MVKISVLKYVLEDVKDLLLMRINEKFFCMEYERSKDVADKIALKAASEGVPIVLLYPGVIYGPDNLTLGNMVARLV